MNQPPVNMQNIQKDLNLNFLLRKTILPYGIELFSMQFDPLDQKHFAVYMYDNLKIEIVLPCLYNLMQTRGEG